MEQSPRSIWEIFRARGELAFQWDPNADAAVFPPRERPGLEWRVSAGDGTVYAATTLHPRGEAPRRIALVDLDEGFRMMGVLEGETAIGDRVRAVPGEELVIFAHP